MGIILYLEIGFKHVLQNPLLSVLVIAHERKEFILDAIDSLRNQLDQKDNYEVIVVKKFRDNAIDSLILSFGYQNIITDKNSLGEKIYVALSYCKGQFISFLEDDDLFVTEKIREIIKKIKENINLIYLHNDHITIDLNGKITGKKLGKSIKNSMLLNLKKCSFIELARLSKYDPDFNLSSITINVKTVEKNKEMLNKTNFSLDAFMYFVAISSEEGSILLFKKELTKFRYYKKNGLTIVPINGRTIESVKNFAELQLDFDKKMLYAMQGRHAKKILKMRVIEDELKLSILNDEISKNISIPNTLLLSVYALRIGEFYKVKLVFLGLLNLINHELSQKLYVKGNLFSSKHYPDIPET